MELSDLETLVREDRVDTVVVGFTDLYGRLMGKRCDFSSRTVIRYHMH